MVLLVIAVSLLAAGCTEIKYSTSSKDNADSVKGTWITAQINAD